MRNAKNIQSKARKHQVTQTSAATYTVKSGSSGSVYTVTQLSAGFTCSCDWGSYRKRNDPRSACSHSVAVVGWLASWEGRRVSAWASEEQAKRQHKSIETGMGDGITVTHRKASAPPILVNWPTGQVSTIEIKESVAA